LGKKILGNDAGLHKLHEMSEQLQAGPKHQVIDPLTKGKK